MKLVEIFESISNNDDMDYVYNNYYIYEEQHDYVIIEESKEKFKINFNPDTNEVIDVSSEGPNFDPNRAKQILMEIKNRVDHGYERP